MSKSSWDPNDAAWHQRWLNVDPRSSFFITMQIFVRVAASVFSKLKNLEKNLNIVIFEILAQPRARQTIWGEVKAEQKIIEQILHTSPAIQIYSIVNFLLEISSFKFGVHLPQMQNSLQVLQVALKNLNSFRSTLQQISKEKFFPVKPTNLSSDSWLLANQCLSYSDLHFCYWSLPS